MTSRPLPAALHPRLTVVRADAGEDVAGLAAQLAAALAGPSELDLRSGPGARLIRGSDVRDAAVRRAVEAFAARAAVRDEAVAHRSGLAARHAHLLEQAEWCEATAGSARAVAAALDGAGSRVDAARAEVDAAARRRDRVAEQRAAAQAAVEEARLELEGLESAAMDETHVRRELEAATRAERDAVAALEAAEREVTELRARLTELEDARDALAAERANVDHELGPSAAGEVEAAVRAALREHDELAQRAGFDAGAAALADALARVDADIAHLRTQVPEPPTIAELDAAEAEIAGIRRHVDSLRAAASSFHGPPPPWWLDLTALHAEAVDAETALQTAGLRKGSARRRYEEAVAAERARLDELGFDSYLDALMSGGRLPNERATDDAAIAEATTALAAAERRAERLRNDARAGEPLADLLDERARLLETAVGVLGCDPADRAVELLLEHPSVPPMVVGDLADALRRAGVVTTGVGVAAAARRWLAELDTARDPARRDELDRRLRTIATEARDLGAALEPAVARAERAGAAATAAARTVSSLEAELRARAGDDGRLLERAGAARELRDQVEAVERRLADADAEALDAWATAAEVLTAAEAERDRLERELADLGRRAMRAAANLPPEHRPAFDVLTGLVPLAGALRAEAAVVAESLAGADAAVDEAESALGGGPGAPGRDDVAAGLVAAVSATGTGPVVLAEPVDTSDLTEVEAVLDTLVGLSVDRPIVVVTNDLVVAGWAIGLASDVGTLLPARSLGDLGTPAERAVARPTVD